MLKHFLTNAGSNLCGNGQMGPSTSVEANVECPECKQALAAKQTTQPAKCEARSAKPITQETRVVDPETGGAKGTKLAKFDQIPVGPLWALAEHFGKGAEKYGADNWRKGYNFSLSFAALQRHAWAWWGGEDLDEETGSSHLTAVAWHAMCLLENMSTHPEKDDRRKK